jgi:hypothetical protein
MLALGKTYGELPGKIRWRFPGEISINYTADKSEYD